MNEPKERMGWNDCVHWIAQAGVNMVEERYNTFGPGSRAQRAIDELCRLLNEGKVVHVEHVGQQGAITPDTASQQIELLLLVADGLATRLMREPQCRTGAVRARAGGGSDSCINLLMKNTRKPMHLWPLKDMCDPCAAYWHATQCAWILRDMRRFERMVEAEAEQAQASGEVR
jgi:hypothetical protein